VRLPNMRECTRFVILAAPRTGSNMLCTILDSHPQILCHHEMFNPDGIFYALGLREGSFNIGTLQDRSRDPLDFLQRIWKADLGHACVGFKMTHWQNETVFNAVLNDPSVKKIVLRRKNRIKTYVSWLVAQQTGQWEVYRKADLARRPRVAVDEAELRQHIAENEQYLSYIERVLDATRQHWASVAYERLLEKSDECERVLQFLEVAAEACRLEPKSVRQNPADLRELICNFDDLDRSWRGTPLHRELHSLEY
jgi:LPS sulfotransferase NodH